MRIHHKYPFILCSLVLCALSSCGKSGVDPVGLNGKSTKLIDSYKEMTELSFNFNASTLSLRIFDNGDHWLSGTERDAMTAKYDDTHYDQVLAPGTYASFSNEFSGITVTSDADFNEITPGENLGGIMRIVSVSPYKWLASKGTLTFDWSVIPSDYQIVLGNDTDDFLRPQNHPVNKSLTALTAEDMLLLNLNCLYLIFSESPAIKTHNLTVVFMEGNKSFSVTKSVTFN